MPVRRPDYTSALAETINAFLDMKASVGLENLTRNYVLYDLDKWLAAHGVASLDEDSVTTWAEDRLGRQPNAGTGSWVAVERDLASYARTVVGEEAWSLPRGWGGKRAQRPPYLLSSDEAEALFLELPRLRWGGSMSWQSTCMFGLMYSCGLRPGEVRGLRPADIRRDSLEIDVVESKGHRSRRLAVTEEVMEMIARCDAETTQAFGPNRSFLFANALGSQVSASTMSRAFRRAWHQAGLPSERHGSKPTCYLLRHHFAYANIERWAREGADVDAMLPYLSRYMGHSSIERTLYYVHTSPDFMAGFADVGSKLDALLPEVGFHG